MLRNQQKKKSEEKRRDGAGNADPEEVKPAEVTQPRV